MWKFIWLVLQCLRIKFHKSLVWVSFWIAEGPYFIKIWVPISKLFFCKNTGIRRAKRRAKFKFFFKKINCAILHQNGWAIEFPNLQLDWMICYVVNNCVPFPQNELASVFSKFQHRWMIYCIAHNCVTSLQYEWSSVLSSAEIAWMIYYIVNV